MSKVLVLKCKKLKRKKSKATLFREMVLFIIGFAVAMTVGEQMLKPYYHSYFKTYQAESEDCKRGGERRENCFYKG
jgi:hypothetical protein